MVEHGGDEVFGHLGDYEPIVLIDGHDLPYPSTGHRLEGMIIRAAIQRPGRRE